MSVDNYKTVPKMGVNKMIKEALEVGYIITNPIEHYSEDEIKEMAELARENNLILTISAEHSNFYQGILINLIKKSRLKEMDGFLKNL